MSIDAAPPLREGVVDLSRLTIPPELLEIIRRRADAADEAGEALAGDLVTLAENVGRAIIESSAGTTDTAELRAALQRVKLEEISALIEAVEAQSGAKARYYDRFNESYDLAIRQLDVMGVPEASRMLDDGAVIAAIGARAEQSDATFWSGKVERPMAERIWSGLRSTATLETLPQAIDRIVSEEGLNYHHAVTEARDEFAEFSRFVAEEGAMVADPQGDTLLRGYIGPDDKITRPFCDVCVGHAFTVEQVAALRNGKTGSGPVIYSCGGPRCRHSLVTGSAERLVSMGYRLATDDTVRAANAAALRGRRKAPK